MRQIQQQGIDGSQMGGRYVLATRQRTTCDWDERRALYTWGLAVLYFLLSEGLLSSPGQQGLAHASPFVIGADP
jgi:hypothetical protein